DVRHYKGATIGQLDDGEVGLEGGERIVGDLGTRGRDHGEERRLPRVWLADESDVGDELELHLDPAVDPFFARLPFARRLMGGGGEESISLPASTTGGDHSLLTVFQYLGDDFAGVRIAKHRAGRD